MSLRADFKYRCDRCGGPLENASVLECAIVADIEVIGDGEGDAYAVPRTLHFCRVPNEGAPEGCAEHLLVPSNLANYNETRA